MSGRDQTVLMDASTGIPLSVTGGILDVNAVFGGVIITSIPFSGITGAAVPAQTGQVGGPDAGGLLRANRLYDTDSGGGSEFTLGVSLRKTAGGGSVEAGTLADPLRTDPTGTTTQPTSNPTQLPAALVGGRLDTNLGAWLGSTVPTVGQKVAAQSIPVVLASDLVNVSTNVAQWGGAATSLGSKVMASSVPVVIASDQTQFPAALVGGRLDINNGAWLGSTAPSVGSKTSANSIPVVIASDQDFVSTGGGALPSRGVQVGGTDGAVMRFQRFFDLDSGAGSQHAQGVNLRLSASGGSIEAMGQKTMASSIPVVWASDFVPGNRTYTAAITNLTLDVAGATDFFTLFGSATQTIYIMRVSVSITATAGVNISAQLRKLSSVLTGGTSAAVAAVPHDSASVAANGTPLSWTVNPTGGGALVGIVGAVKLPVPAAATPTAVPTWVWNFGGPADAQPIILRGVAQGLAVNIVGALVAAGATANVEIEWTETTP